jgi:hypothetical protein
MRSIWYGDPTVPFDELLGGDGKEAPEDGDELCDGHQMHYEWKDGRWQ